MPGPHFSWFGESGYSVNPPLILTGQAEIQTVYTLTHILSRTALSSPGHTVLPVWLHVIYIIIINFTGIIT